jgi:hypothetical protein
VACSTTSTDDVVLSCYGTGAAPVLQAAQRQLAHEMSKNKVTSLLKSRPAPEDLPDSILPGIYRGLSLLVSANTYFMFVSVGSSSMCSCRVHVCYSAAFVVSYVVLSTSGAAPKLDNKSDYN